MSDSGSEDDDIFTGYQGHRGFELTRPGYSPRRNRSRTINGQTYSGHAIDQMQNRGILPLVVEATIQKGQHFITRKGTIGFYDSENKLRVIVNSVTGVVVTVFYGRL